jgi:hypothetical protein
MVSPRRLRNLVGELTKMRCCSRSSDTAMVWLENLEGLLVEEGGGLRLAWTELSPGPRSSA